MDKLVTTAIHGFANKMTNNTKLSASKRSQYYGSMPNLMANSNIRPKQSQYDKSPKFVRADNGYRAMNNDDYPEEIDLTLGTEVRVRQDRDIKRERAVKVRKQWQQENNSYNPLATMSDEDAPDRVVWQPEEHEARGFSPDVNHKNKSHYPNQTNDELHDRPVYASGDKQSFVSDHAGTERAPLTFTQANEALNHMQLSHGKPAHVYRRESGAKSAESIYDVDDGLTDEDNDVNLSYEQAYEAKLHEQDMLLDLMLMEKMNCEGRIEMALQYRRELENQLRMFRQYRNYRNGRSPHRYSYIPRGVHQLNYSNMNPRKLPHMSRFAMRPSGKLTNIDYVSWPYSSRAVPIGYNQYASGSMDSIDDVTRSSMWTPEERDRLSCQPPYSANQHYMRSPYEAQAPGTQFDELSFVPVRKGEAPSHGDQVEESRLIPNARYSMFVLGSTGSPLVSPTSGHEAHEPMRQPGIRSKSPLLNQPMKSIYIKANRRIAPSSAVLPQPYRLVDEPYNSNDPVGQNTSSHGSPAADQSADYISHVPRPEVRRRLQGVQRIRPYSQDRLPDEMIDENVHRRQDVAQSQQRRETHAKRYTTQQSQEDPNTFAEFEHPAEQISRSASNLYYKPKDQIALEHHSSPQPVATRPSKQRIIRSSSPDEPIDPELAEICSRENLPVSPSSRRTTQINGTRVCSTFDPLTEYSEEEVESIRSSTPTQATVLPIVPETEVEQAPMRTNVSPTMDDAKMFHAKPAELSGSSNRTKSPLENETKPVDNQSSQEPAQRPQVRILRVRSAIPFVAKPPSQDESIRDLSKHTGSITIDDVYESPPVHRSPNQIVSTSNNVAAATSSNLVPIEVKSPLCSMEERNSVRRNSREIIFVKESVRLLCLGPVDGRNMETHYNTQRSGTCSENRFITLPPSWIAVCLGDANVFVYDLKSRACIMNCEEHLRYSRCPVVALLPFVSQTMCSIQSNSSARENQEEVPNGLLCVVQDDGNMTLYDVANQRVCGKMSTKQNIRFATLLPQPRVIQNFLAQYVLATTWFGTVSCIQWNLTGYSREKDQERHPHWESEIHDLGINIFDRLSEDGRTVPYVCCICPQLATTPSPGAGSCSPRSPVGASKDLPIGHFNLIAASQLKSADSTTTTVRICRWAIKSSQLKLALCIDKNLVCESESSLVGITYAEIGGAASICLCMTTDIFWFSLRSSDLVSSFKLPACTQPAALLPSIWPYKFLSSAMKTKPNERLWTVVGTGHVLELSAVDSQRRRDASGRTCLVLLSVHPSDSVITAITSTMYEQELVIAGTDKGEIHIIPISADCYVCRVPNCVLGFCTKENLVYHLVRDHYLVDCPTTPNATIHCMWPNCDYPIKEINGRINLGRLETHAEQHVSNQSN